MIHKTPHFSLDTDTLSVHDAEGNCIKMQNKEFELLRFLCEQNKACSEDEILESVWDKNADYSSNVVHVTLSKIRKKLGKDAVITKHNKFLVETFVSQEKAKTTKWVHKIFTIFGVFLCGILIFFLFYKSPSIVISDMKVQAENNSSDEWIVLSNNSNKTVSLWGWKLQDEALHTYVFGNREIGANGSLKVMSGVCADDENQVCWNFKQGVWNDEKDRILLKNEKGKTVYEYSYDFTKN